MAARYGADTSILDWRERQVCSRCGGRDVDFVATGPSASSRRKASASNMADRDLTAAMLTAGMLPTLPIPRSQARGKRRPA